MVKISLFCSISLSFQLGTSMTIWRTLRRRQLPTENMIMKATTQLFSNISTLRLISNKYCTTLLDLFRTKR